MDLSKYNKGNYHPEASFLRQLLWFYLGSPIVSSYLLPFTSLKILVLRLFGATIGNGVRIKPGVRIKFPWKLFIDDHTWIGEAVWIDNLDQVSIGSHCCLSQGVYLCTGNHDWSTQSFDLKISPIVLENHCWIAARSSIGPGVVAREGAVLTFGSVASKELAAWTIHSGNPCAVLAKRKCP